MRAYLPILSILGLFALAGCDSSDTGVGGAVRYDLVLTESGATAGTGSVTFASRPVRGGTISGQYSLAAGGAPIEPLTTTSGTFSGNFEGDSLIVTILSPGTSDVGLRFAGIVSSTTYSGNWSEITIAGPQLRGTFVGEAR